MNENSICVENGGYSFGEFLDVFLNGSHYIFWYGNGYISLIIRDDAISDES